MTWQRLAISVPRDRDEKFLDELFQLADELGRPSLLHLGGLRSTRKVRSIRVGFSAKKSAMGGKGKFFGG